MFVPVGYEQSFGELDPELKHQISHRADAFRKLLAALNE
jgi:XTP/dITP diphosphohydrolase